MAENENTTVPQENTEGQIEEQTQTSDEKAEGLFKEEGAPDTPKEDVPAEGDKAEGEKEEVKADEPVGDDWMPELPEGMSVDEEALKEARTLLKEMGLTPDKAQKLAEFQAKQVENIRTKTAEAWEKQVSEWETSVKNDPLFKDDFNSKKAIAEKGFKELFTQEERKWLSETGISSYIFRAMFKAGERIAEPQGELESKRGNKPRSSDPYVGLEGMFGSKK